MKNNHYVQVLMMAGAALVLLTAPSMAMEKEHGPGPGPKKGGEEQMKHEQARWQEEENSLGLSEEQRAKMKTVREQAKEKQDAFRTQLKAKHEALGQELDAQKPDRAKAEAIVMELGALEQQMGLDRVDMIFQIRAILTPEQYQKLQALHEKRRAEMKQQQQAGKKPEGRREHTEAK